MAMSLSRADRTSVKEVDGRGGSASTREGFKETTTAKKKKKRVSFFGRHRQKKEQQQQYCCSFVRRCRFLAREQRARFYILRRCIVMLVCSSERDDS